MAIVLTEQLQYEYGKFYFKDKNGKLLKEIVPEGTSITNKLVNEQQLNSKTVATVVDELPAPSELTVNLVYIAPSEHTETGDIYSEYVTVYKNGAYSWEKMGAPIDMSHVVFWEDTLLLVQIKQLKDELNNIIYPRTTESAVLDESGTSLESKMASILLSIGNLATGKEDLTTLFPMTTAVSALTTEAGKYYRLDVAVNTLTVTLPTMIDLTTARTVVIYLTAGTTPAVTISATDNKNVYYQDGFEIEASKTYEINALFNGAAWIVAAVEINISNS